MVLLLVPYMRGSAGAHGLRETIMLVVTRIPTHRNDGSKISQRGRAPSCPSFVTRLEAIPWRVHSRVAWVADDGRVYEESSYRLEVLVPPERVSEAREVFTRVGKELGQRAIYFEVREAGEIIDLD